MIRFSSATALFGTVLLAFSFNAWATGVTGITYEGRLMKPDGTTPVTGVTTVFKIQVRSPGNENCLIYEETQTRNMSLSNGFFAVTLNDGGTPAGSNLYSFERAFANFPVSMTFATGDCGVGTTYTPQPGDRRRLVVQFQDETMTVTGFEAFPAQAINYVPLAIEAKRLAGFDVERLMRVTESDGITPSISPISPLNNTQFAELTALVNGTSTKYPQVTNVAGTRVFTASASSAPTAPVAGTIWYDSTNLALKVYNGSAFQSLATSVASGITSLTGDVTASGTGSVVATVAQVGGVTAANIAAGANLSNAATNANTSNSIVKRDGSGNFAAGTVSTLTTKADTLSLNNAGSILNITNPVGGMWNMVLPATAGSNGQVMQTNGLGVMSWITALTPSSGFINTGNSFGTNSSIGNNDAFDFSVRTSGLPRITVAATSGNVGIGTTAPAYSLDVIGIVKAERFLPNTAGTVGASCNPVGAIVKDNAGTPVYCSPAPSYWTYLYNSQPASTTSASVDFLTNPVQSTTLSCQPFTLTNIKSGQTYRLLIKGGSVTTCTFSAFSDGGATPVVPVTLHSSVAFNAISAKWAQATITSYGSDAVVTWDNAINP